FGAPVAASRDDLRLLIADHLIRARKRAGLSMAEVARHLGRSRNTVADWERGSTSPTALDLADLLEIYRVPADRIFGRGSVGLFALVDRDAEDRLIKARTYSEWQADVPLLATTVHD